MGALTDKVALITGGSTGLAGASGDKLEALFANTVPLGRILYRVG
jgi:NADP-dependent 3-hydroxy acid dehydrogenase YdfG